MLHTFTTLKKNRVRFLKILSKKLRNITKVAKTVSLFSVYTKTKFFCIHVLCARTHYYQTIYSWSQYNSWNSNWKYLSYVNFIEYMEIQVCFNYSSEYLKFQCRLITSSTSQKWSSFWTRSFLYKDQHSINVGY